MSQSEEIYDNINLDALHIFETSKCDLLSWLVRFETPDGRLHTSGATYEASSANQKTKVTRGDDKLVYGMASLFKLFIAVMAVLVIDVLAESPEPDNKKYRGMKGAWIQTFTDVFNKYSKDGLRIPSLPGNPTVRDVLLHFKGFPDFNHELFAPDASHIMSMNEFISQIISQYSEDAYGKSNEGEIQVTYSNANYIIFARLLELVLSQGDEPETFCDFLQKRVFEKLGMTRTHLTFESMASLPSKDRAHRYVVSSDGIKQRIRTFYPADTIELAILGGETCASDIDLLLEALNPKSDLLFPRGVPTTLFRGTGRFSRENIDGYKLCGLFTTLDTTLAGSHSQNRQLSRNKKFLKLRMGNIPRSKEPVQVYYLAGTATGVCNTIYYLPDKRITVIVLTNTSSNIDASDLVSRHCLQEILGLRKVDYGKWAVKLYQEIALTRERVEKKDSVPDTDTADCLYVLGTYYKNGSKQKMRIFDWKSGEDSNKKGVLRITVSGPSKGSQKMRLVLVNKENDDKEKKKNFLLPILRSQRKDAKSSQRVVFRICSLAQTKTESSAVIESVSSGSAEAAEQSGCACLAIDCYGGCWKDLDMEFHKDGNTASLSRKRNYSVDVFVRRDE